MTLKKRLILFLPAFCIFLSSCSILFPGYDKPVPKINSKPLAYYIPDQRDIHNPQKMIKARGDLNEIVLLVSEVIQTKTGVNTIMLRNNSEEPGIGGKRELMRIVSDPVRLDSIGDMKKNFMIGYYLMEDPRYLVEPQKMNYAVQASISMRGMDILIEFTLIGNVDWTLYSISKKGKKKKLSQKEEIEFGIGAYQNATEEKRTNKRGREVKAIIINNVEIRDQPKTNGNGEEELFNLTIDKLSIKNITAQII
jgi:hypothetical protein